MRKNSLRRPPHGSIAIPLSFAGIVILFMLFAFSFAALGQEPDDASPPPLRTVTKIEKAQLEASPDGRRRTELALQLMASRLQRAEDQKTKEDYRAMFLELGGFHGLMDNTLAYITAENHRQAKALNYFKKYEMGLRAFAPRLELIRRDLPSRYDPYIKALLQYLRDARSRALEPFFGDTVIPKSKT